MIGPPEKIPVLPMANPPMPKSATLCSLHDLKAVDTEHRHTYLLEKRNISQWRFIMLCFIYNAANFKCYYKGFIVGIQSTRLSKKARQGKAVLFI